MDDTRMSEVPLCPILFPALNVAENLMRQRVDDYVAGECMLTYCAMYVETGETERGETIGHCALATLKEAERGMCDA